MGGIGLTRRLSLSRAGRFTAHALQTRLALLLLDAVMITGIYTILVVMRFDARIPTGYWTGFGWFVAVGLVVHLSINASFGLYSAVWSLASSSEARRVLSAGSLSLVVMTVVAFADRSAVPLSLPVVGGVFVTGACGLLRFQSRLFVQRRSLEAKKEEALTRVAVIGAGAAGAQVVRSMLEDEGHTYAPVLFLDDDVRKVGKRILGLPVHGPVSRIAEFADDIDSVLIALPTADSSTVRRMTRLVEDASLPLKLVPHIRELLADDDGEKSVSVRDVRDLQIDDLLGRPEVTTDLDAVRSMIKGRCVVVTGGGGSIGSEIARQISEFEPGRLLLLDCDETHLHDARAKIDPSVGAESILVNVRDRARVLRIFESVRPELVLHAAALKHVPVLEDYADEAFKTNIAGTDAVFEAAAAVGTDRLVFISTDKAVNPSSVMGATKWFGEQLLLDRAPEGSNWSCVRFGNVLGSRGSVLPTFERQIRMGGPVTVTDPRMTRFFMSVQEAVQLVLQAATMTDGRNIFMLDMGEPASIMHLAEQMIRLTGQEPGVDIDIEITGMRVGEKLHEELRSSNEDVRLTAHPAVRELLPKRLESKTLSALIHTLSRAVVAEAPNDELAVLIRTLAKIGQQPTDQIQPHLQPH